MYIDQRKYKKHIADAAKKGTIQCTTQNGMLLMRLQINVPRRSYSRFWTRATSRLTYYSPRSFSRHSFDPSAFTRVLFWWTNHLSDRLMLLSTGDVESDVINVLFSLFRFDNECAKKTTKIARFIIHYKHWFSGMIRVTLPPNLPLNFSK